jgi:hypothetical protein
MPDLFRRRFDMGWYPDADAENAAQGVLLRADNLTLDQEGALSLRKGSTLLHVSLGSTDRGGSTYPVETLASFTLNGVMSNYAASGPNVYRNGQHMAATFSGDGDVAFGTDAYQVFMARSNSKKKYDGNRVHNWGIPAPELAPTVSGANAYTTEIANFDSTESPAFTTTEGTGAFITGYNGTANGALQLTVNSTNGRAATYKKWASDQDFQDISGALGGDTDLFDMYIALSDPDRTETITVMFGLGTGSDPFLTDYFYFDFKIKDRITVDVKDAASSVPSVYGASAMEATESIRPEEVTNVKTPQEVQVVLQRLGRFAGPRSRERKDSVHGSPAWSHLAVTRGQFNRIGGTEGRGWKTIRAFKIVAQTSAGASYTVSLDSTIFYGGGTRALTGRYRLGYRYVRNFRDGTYYELSPMSPISDPIVLNQQGLNLTIPASAVTGADPQVNEIWVYLYGGFLDQFYRVAILAGIQSSNMSMDEFDPAGDGIIDASDRTRFTQWGLTIPGFTTSGEIHASILTSEIEAIRGNVTLEPGCVLPPNNIVAIEGPYNGRMFVLTNEGWLYLSSQTSPSNFSAYHTLDLRKYGDPRWMKKTSGGIHVGMSTDIIRIDGSGDESEDRLSIDLYPTPLHISNPPVDTAVYGDGSTLVYRAADGLMTLSGVQIAPVSERGTTLLWRGLSRHGVEPLDTETGRFRLAVDDNTLYMLAPEGPDATDGSLAIWRYDAPRDKWYRTVYPNKITTIIRDGLGRVLAGDIEGSVWLLEDGVQDGVEDIPVYLVTPIDDDGSPLSLKTAFDLHTDVDTGGQLATIDALVNGSANVASSYAVVSTAAQTFRQSVNDLPDFTQFQFRLRGSFSRFLLRWLSMAYRLHPPQTMVVDTGYLVPPGNGDLGWVASVEVSTRSDFPLELLPIFDDVEKDMLPIPIRADKTTTYRVLLKRGQDHGRRPRFLLRTTAPAGIGHIGFEPYWMRVHFRGTGNSTENTLEINLGSVRSAA